MTRCGVSTPLLAFLTLFDFMVGWNAALNNCQDYRSGSVLKVPKGKSCELTTDIVENIDVDIKGQVTVPVDATKHYTIACTNFFIASGGKLTLSGSGYENGTGPGAGNANGIGGIMLFSLFISLTFSKMDFGLPRFPFVFFFCFFFVVFFFFLFFFLFFCFFFLSYRQFGHPYTNI